MATRRPSVYGNNPWVFQDFPYHEDGTEVLRYVVAKVGTEPFVRYLETFDFTTPTYSAGDVVARIDYTVTGKLITIDHWQNQWRDEFPLRALSQYLTNCLYSSSLGYRFRVDKSALPFWVSERFEPTGNLPGDYLIK